jgi:hypothetical protein
MSKDSLIGKPLGIPSIQIGREPLLAVVTTRSWWGYACVPTLG